MTIVQAAQSFGIFNQLLGAVAYVDSELNAGLGEALSTNQGQTTVFAPDDDAFVALLEFLDGVRDETIDDITDIPAPIVLAVLEYHLTPGRRGSNSVLARGRNNRTIQTMLDGASFQVDKTGNIFAVGNSSKIFLANQSASNGMVHAIEDVLLPLTPGDILALWDELEGN
ncbi:fasciclin domain-containing protein [Lutimonas saemankumensis]|uniref:fasciclin domain-containing protein n=1 Tax=Lutimonas saemankumensis TaxID=483016 RepID=UPI001CD80D71|nr:fasciclin domain-containing protein [Lutimonas saemankumensis]MCA0931434.1 fasciclin domain-containing protein [Lutimonas saemankumensis]